MIEALAKLIKKVDNRVTNLIKLGKVSRFLEDNREIPVVQVTYLGDITGNATVILPFGMSAGLPEDTLGILLNSFGNDRLFIPFSTSKRVKNLKRNETAIGYGDQTSEQTYIKFDEDGNIIIEAAKEINIKAAQNVNVDAAQVNLGTGGGLKKIARDGDSVVSGQIVASGTNETL